MNKFLLILFSSLFLVPAEGPKTPYENSNYKRSATHAEAISFYREMEKMSGKVSLMEYGKTDVGEPLHLVVVSSDGVTVPSYHRKAKRQVVMVLNGIHPGESCGVDASMMLVRDLATSATYDALLENVVFVVVPLYNIGGSLNRSCCTRANQVGPEEQGFRGNGRLLDLNRDFIKQDSRNARSFARMFQEWDPDLFIDTHTTNGADYPAVLTLIPTQQNKLNPELKEYFEGTLMKDLYGAMNKTEYPTTPYMNMVKQTPDSGIVDFYDMPRYSTGYVSLFQTMGITSEAHMYKSFEQRVEATYLLLLNALKFVNRDRVFIQRARTRARKEIKDRVQFHLNWSPDFTEKEKLNFKGYEARYKKSAITGQDRLYYDRERAWVRDIAHYRTYQPTLTVRKPYAYVVPQAWGEVVDRLQTNGVEMTQLTEDVPLSGTMYYLDDYQSTPFAYEGHYLHYQTKVRKETQTVQFRKGDWVVIPDQYRNRYIVETLEPEAPDSWFSWNFFDEILMQKEYFSGYIFEDYAEEMVKENPSLMEELNAAKAADSTLNANARAQLDFLYKRSKYYEPTHLRYPVMRLENKVKLPLKK